MPILHAHSFLVHPGKNDEVQLEIGGVQIRPGNRVFAMLAKLYERAHLECNIEILFRSHNGVQENECRDLMVAYANDPNMENGRRVAARLQCVTTHRSGLGLFFLAAGDDQGKLLMVSRFPAGEGVVAEERERQRLQVQFIERIFMKSARAYKSAVYSGPAGDGSFWYGHAVDKQMNDALELPNYWIGDFLDSELATTGPAATRRFAIALREAIKTTENPDVRDELIASARLARNYNGNAVTAQGLSGNLGLSPEATNAIRNKMPRPELFEQTFRFDRREFDEHLLYRSVQLSNGAVLSAENARFDEVFARTPAVGNEAMFTTTGSVVTDRLKRDA